MIISHKYKFIFLKTNKTAGTSIEIALSKHCGADDVITPSMPEDEKIRKELGYPGPQNYLAPLSAYGLSDFVKLLFRQKKKKLFHNHIDAQKVKAAVGEKIWNEYYKFCFERNPFDRFISLYYWSYKTEPRPPISTLINSKEVQVLKRKGFDVYTIDGKVAVDKVCRFENIAQELEEVRLRLGLPEKLDLPRAKSNFRKDKRSYREILNEEDRTMIAELFRDEINLFGYEF